LFKKMYKFTKFDQDTEKELSKLSKYVTIY